MSKSLTNRLYLKKQLYELRMDEDGDVKDHINKFNMCITQLSNVEVNIDKEDRAIILLAFLSKSYESLVTTLLVGKTTLTMDEVSNALLETANMKKPCRSSHTDQALVMKSDLNRGRSKSRRRYYDRKDGHHFSNHIHERILSVIIIMRRDI